MSGTASSPADRYFRSIEDTFIRLRGAPLLLSPADWQTARRWHEEGVPLELVQRVLEEVFERLRERDPERKIHGLRYCAPAVEEAWREVRDLSATEGRLEPEPLDVDERLRRLSEAVPDELPDAPVLKGEIVGLGGEAEMVERRLREIEHRTIDRLVAAVSTESLEEVERRVERALEKAGRRIAAAERPSVEQRLRRDFLRQEVGLPTLSLFSAAAEPSSSEPSSSEPSGSAQPGPE